ncbi:hypothetical protein ACFL2K_00020 [Candidatus Margulisiibacteriota bacterium]
MKLSGNSKKIGNKLSYYKKNNKSNQFSHLSFKINIDKMKKRGKAKKFNKIFKIRIRKKKRYNPTTRTPIFTS